MAASLVHGALCVINSHIGLTPAAQNSCCSYKLVANYQPCLTFVFLLFFSPCLTSYRLLSVTTEVCGILVCSEFIFGTSTVKWGPKFGSRVRMFQMTNFHDVQREV